MFCEIGLFTVFSKTVRVKKFWSESSGNPLWKRLFMIKTEGFQATILLNKNFSTFSFQGLCQLLWAPVWRNEFKLLDSSATWVLKLFLWSHKWVSKTVDLLRKLQNVLLGNPKLFVRPHLNHSDIIYEQKVDYHLAACLRILLLEISTLPILVDISVVKRFMLVTWFKDHVALRVGASHNMSTSWLHFSS